MMIPKTKYEEYMAKEYVAVKPEDIPFYVDFRGLRSYAESQGKSVSSLTDEEKRRFVFSRS